jgi:hypothetical protein
MKFTLRHQKIKSPYGVVFILSIITADKMSLRLAQKQRGT